VGFKSDRATFKDAFYQRLRTASAANPATGRTGTNPVQIGLGTNLGSIDTLMTQGLYQRTGRSLDALVQGDGMFIVSDGSGTYFTRAGNIDLDGEMNMNINGLNLMGWDVEKVDGKYVVVPGAVKPLNLGGDKLIMEPEATSLIELAGNLSPAGLINNQTTRTMTVKDTLGNTHVLDVVFTYHGEQNINNRSGDPVHGFWTYEFKTVFDTQTGQYAVMAYPEGDKNREFGKRIGVHVGNQSNMGAIAESHIQAGNLLSEFVPKGILVFDTNGKLVAADTLTDALVYGHGTTGLKPEDAEQYNNLLNIRTLAANAVSALRPQYEAAVNAVTNAQNNYNYRSIVLKDAENAFKTLEGIYNAAYSNNPEDPALIGMRAELDVLESNLVAAGGIFNASAETLEAAQEALAGIKPGYDALVAAHRKANDDVNAFLQRSRPENSVSRGLSGALDNNNMLRGDKQLTFNQAAISGIFGNNTRDLNIYLSPAEALEPPATFGSPAEPEFSIIYELDYVNGENVKRVGQINMDLTNLTQWREDTASTKDTQIISARFSELNGHTQGKLMDIAIMQDGAVIGMYSNTLTRVLGQIPVAHFQNAQGLQKMGNNLFAVSANSGAFDGMGDVGTIRSGGLEMSNVDLAEEFTNMIVTQRGFQANTRIISVSDDLLQELVNLKR
jgi:flagellar hook protein FlgE